jgi:hypothetical protein
VVTKAATDTADAAKQKAGETAQFIQDKAADAVQYAKGPAAADKEATTDNVCSERGRFAAHIVHHHN